MTPANISAQDSGNVVSIHMIKMLLRTCAVPSGSWNPETTEESSVSTGSEIIFTEEEEKLYQTRYEEGYNLFDEKYVKWLYQNHPSDIVAYLQPLTQSMPSTSQSHA